MVDTAHPAPARPTSRVPRQRTTLTDEQLRAVTAVAPCVFIEAAPGSGKTTVAAHRFGLLRFAPGDNRAVVAVSFTRSATRELHQRIIRTWGTAALAAPHRVITIDTLLWELLTFLLRAGHLTWPGGHTDLSVIDTWKLWVEHHWTRYQPYLTIRGRTVTPTGGFARLYGNRVDETKFTASVRAGVCTHDDVRAVLTAAVHDPHLRKLLTDRIEHSVRALIVDEVFDANPLDLDLVSFAAERGAATTIIGDPWQALYRFRGAGPHLVPELTDRHGFVTYPLTRSFRFTGEQSQELARALRARVPVTVPGRVGQSLDVVLAGTWKDLWAVGGGVLPLSFGSPDSVPAATALLLLDFVTTTALDTPAVFRDEALTQLGIVDPAARGRLTGHLADVVATLRRAGGRVSEKAIVDTAWEQLVVAVRTESPREFPNRHHTHTARLRLLRTHLTGGGVHPVPGITVHQAKGREWRRVGVRLADVDVRRLRAGLNPDEEEDRRVYVALTRGKDLTVTV